MSLPINKSQDFVQEVRDIVTNNLDNADFSIDYLCGQVGLSRSQLHRRIKSATKLSTSLFIRKIRLEEAKKLLDSTDLTMAEIAYDIGIPSPQNFTKYFIKEYGINPSGYRKRQTTGINTSYQTNEVIKIPKKKLSSNPVFIYSSIFALILIFIFILLPQFGTKKPPANEGQPSIAVIPFKNLNAEADIFFSEGVVEDILTHLASFKNLKIISRTSTERYKNTEKNIQDIGIELGVSFILEGSVRQHDNQVRITAQLIRAEDDKHIWAQNFDSPLENIMKIQSEVALEIAKALNQNISAEEEEKLERLPTESVEAYNEVLKGRYLLSTRSMEELETSITHFDQALELDPNYSEAYVGKATAFFLLKNLYRKSDSIGKYQQKAEENALKAIKEDVNNAQAYAILGNIYHDQYRWNEATTAYEIAFDLNPNDALINYWYALDLRTIGDLELALEHHKIASDLDPLYPVVNAGYIYTCALAKEFDLAKDLIEKGSIIFKNSFLHELVKGFVFFTKKEYVEAIHHYDQSLALNPNFRSAKAYKLNAQGKLGQKEIILSYIESLDFDKDRDCLRGAKAYLSLGKTKQGLDLLKKAANMGFIDSDMLVDPMYEDIRNHPTFLSILKDYNLLEFLKNVE